jgi:hypothetical protein
MTARHTCNVPSDRSRIRIMREGLTREEADRWEIFYINRFGRKAEGGVLVNMREGGEGGAHDEETNARIAAKVSEHYANGVYASLNAPETVQRRASERMANKAAEFGIPADDYATMTKSRRSQCKKWLAANPEATYADFLANGKTAKAAAKYGLTVDEWTALSGKQRNCLKEWMNRFPDRSAHDWLAGERAVGGSKPRVSKEQVIALVTQGMTRRAVAEVVGCSAAQVSRIALGQRQAIR